MLLKSVTLEMSKLRGWSKADAPCRVEGKSAGLGVVRGRGGGVGRRRGQSVQEGWRGGVWVCMEIVGRRWKARAERTENMATMLVTLEVSKRSGWLNDDAPCKAGRRAHIRCGSRETGEKACGAARRREQTGGAHGEHGPHVCDAGRVERQRLVERRCVLSRRAYGAGRREGGDCDQARVYIGVDVRSPGTCSPCL